MAVSVATILTLVKVLIVFLATGIPTFLALYYHWSLDSQTESFDEDLRSEIADDPTFEGIRTGADTRIIVSSDSRLSKAMAPVKKRRGNWADDPYKIVPVEGNDLQDRKIEIIFERCKDVPGKTIIHSDLLASMRNYYAFRLALKEEGADSEVTEHFKSRFEEYEYSKRVKALGQSEHFETTYLLDREAPNIEPLGDVFIPMLRGAQRHCVGAIQDFDDLESEIDRCREFMMFTFWGLYTGEMRGLIPDGELSQDEYVNLFKEDIRDRDNLGYWLLPAEGDGEEDFNRFKHLSWLVSDELDDYWGSDNYTQLHPQADSIPDMEYAESAFMLFKKNTEEFEGGPKRMRIQEDPTFRRKQEHRESAT